MKKGSYVYDEEHYPNLSSFAFKDINTGNKLLFYAYHSPDGSLVQNTIKELLYFIKMDVAWLIGYNNKEYDDTILSSLLAKKEIMETANAKMITQHCYRTNCEILGQTKDLDDEEYDEYAMDDDDDEDEEPTTVGKRKMAPVVYTYQRQEYFKSLDLLLLFNRVNRVSLKQLAIGMKWPKIQDLPIKPGTIIMPDDLETVLDYQWNDVDITEHAMNTVLAKQINNRFLMTKTLELNVYNACDTDLAKLVIGDRYAKATGLNYKEFSNRKTIVRKLFLKDCISPKINFKTREYNKLLAKFITTAIDPIEERLKKKEDKFRAIIKSRYLEHTVALGGIHSNNPPELLMETEDTFYVDLDVTSYYPWVIINENYFPRHMNKVFTKVYKEDIVLKRMEAVANGDKILADMLKITANSTFGQTNSIHSWMYDPLMANSICINGQMFLIMLMEAIEMHTSCAIVYSNTDGLTVRVPKHEYYSFKRICDAWCKYLKFDLKFTRYKKMVIRDVNNYLIMTDDLETPIKRKGRYEFKREAYKGYNYPIIGYALNEFYTKGTGIEETIRTCEDPFLFLKSEKSSPLKFRIELEHASGKVDYLQKNNRWIVTKGNPEEGRITKVDIHDGKITNLQKGWLVTVLNDIDTSVTVDKYNINYKFYLDETQKLINDVNYKPRETHNTPKHVQTKMVF